MSGNGREALPDVRVWWEALSDIREASRMSGSGWEAHPDVREWSEVPTGSPRSPLRCPRVGGRPPEYPGVVGMPSRMFGNGWEAILDVREWSGGFPGCPSGREALPDVWEWSGNPPG